MSRQANLATPERMQVIALRDPAAEAKRAPPR